LLLGIYERAGESAQQEALLKMMIKRYKDSRKVRASLSHLYRASLSHRVVVAVAAAVVGKYGGDHKDLLAQLPVLVIPTVFATVPPAAEAATKADSAVT
jgi:hypothetical protein